MAASQPTLPLRSPPPAVDAERSGFGQRRQSFAPGGKAWTDDGQAQLHGGLATLLLVDRAHAGPFVIVEQRHVEGARDVPLPMLGRTADVDDLPLPLQKALHRSSDVHPIPTASLRY